MNVLLIYYSFTSQAERAVQEMRRALVEDGHQVVVGRIDYSDPAARLQRPISWDEISRLGKLSRDGVHVPVDLTVDGEGAEETDLIVLCSNTWNFSPAVPVQSFLADADGVRLLKGKKVAVAIICRGFWRSNLKKLRPLITATGAELIGHDAFTHDGAWLTSTIQTVKHMTSLTDTGRFGVLPLPKFGLSDTSMRRIAPFIRQMLTRASRS